MPYGQFQWACAAQCRPVQTCAARSVFPWGASASKANIDSLSARGVSGKLQRAGRHQVGKQYVGDGSWVGGVVSQ